MRPRVVQTRVVDRDDGNAFRDQLFDAEHPADGIVSRDMALHAHVSEQGRRFSVDIRYSVSGRLTRVYERRITRVAHLSWPVTALELESVLGPQ